VEIQLVWFKRDLRIDDHRPLVEASRRGPVLPIYIVEPEYWRQPDTSQRQQQFIAESLLALHTRLVSLGQGLFVMQGNAVEVMERLHARWKFADVFAHEETGNAWTFERDKAVRAWARRRNVRFHEYPQFGVVRGLRERTGWAGCWERFMAEPALPPPSALPTVVDTDLSDRPFAGAPAKYALECREPQRGGLEQGTKVLDSFLSDRGSRYRGGISSPLSAQTAGSRLSPHIAYGTLSLRQIVQQTRSRIDHAKDAGESRLVRSFRHFDQRLHWHCHFIQKLEQQPRLEFENVHRGFDGMREKDFNREKFCAWSEGRTGYPLVDACMRFLVHTGWLNFRMRALLMSFAAYHLWLHWREPSLHLARLFTDYEPGIHYNQCQMQSGTTGINTLRIYNPVKQARDQDPEALFVQRWVPELSGVPSEQCFEPWKLGQAKRQRFGAGDYPEPIVDHQVAARRAKWVLADYRKRPGFAAQAQEVQRALGSRRPSRTKRKQSDQKQLRLF